MELLAHSINIPTPARDGRSIHGHVRRWDAVTYEKLGLDGRFPQLILYNSLLFLLQQSSIKRIGFSLADLAEYAVSRSDEPATLRTTPQLGEVFLAEQIPVRVNHHGRLWTGAPGAISIARTDRTGHRLFPPCAIDGISHLHVRLTITRSLMRQEGTPVIMQHVYLGKAIPRHGAEFVKVLELAHIVWYSLPLLLHGVSSVVIGVDVYGVCPETVSASASPRVGTLSHTLPDTGAAPRR
jgi:hypothetical protein